MTYPLYCLTWSAAHLSFQNYRFGLRIFWDCDCWDRLYFFGQDLLGNCLLYWCCKYIITLCLFQVDQWNICIICIPRKWRMETNLSKEESVYKQHCIFPTFNCSTAVPCPLCRCQRSEIQDRNKSWGFGVLCRSMHCWTPLEGTLSRALKECHEEWSNIPVVQIHISFSGFHCIEIISSGWSCAMAHIAFCRLLIVEAQVWSPNGQCEISVA